MLLWELLRDMRDRTLLSESERLRRVDELGTGTAVGLRRSGEGTGCATSVCELWKVWTDFDDMGDMGRDLDGALSAVESCESLSSQLSSSLVE